MIEQKNILIEETRGKLKNNDKNLDALAQEAKNLKELMASIEINRKKVSKLEQEMGLNKPSEAQKSQKNSLSSVSQYLLLPFSRAKGRLFSPAAGDTVTGFGEAVENSDGLSKGIYIAARGKAQVVAPYSGMVAYAGDFRGYGLLLIIDHGEGYHSVLSGMRRLLTSVGQHVLAGEPIAVMNDTGGKPPLYFELRQNGQPVNPLPWLMAR